MHEAPLPYPEEKFSGSVEASAVLMKTLLNSFSFPFFVYINSNKGETCLGINVIKSMQLKLDERSKFILNKQTKTHKKACFLPSPGHCKNILLLLEVLSNSWRIGDIFESKWFD